MTIQPANDRLLKITRLILTLMMGLTILAATVMLLVIPLLFVRRGDVAAELAASQIDPAAIPSMALLLLLGATIAGLGFFFFRHLRRIVDSVSQGDPFVPINADRLRAMAWLSLGIQAALIAATPLIYWFDALPYKPNVHHDSEGISFGSLILALLLFILARVFRVGSQMREELEGTV
jgi:hypothetical protein